jgi:uncharacterized membrane protein
MGTSSTVNPVKKHRRQVWRLVIAPVALPLLGLIAFCVVLIVAVATDTLEFRQVSVIMGLVATAFIALPMTILCVVSYLIFAFLAAGSSLAYSQTRGPLRAARVFSERVAVKTDEVAPRVARPFVALNVRITKWERIAQKLGPSVDDSDGR